MEIQFICVRGKKYNDNLTRFEYPSNCAIYALYEFFFFIYICKRISDVTIAIH